jgi:amino acid adenylation domain-containing protein
METALENCARSIDAIGSDALGQTYPELFVEAANRYPDAPALQFQNADWTYNQLNARANQVAHFLRSQGLGPESLVAVSVERSFEQMMLLLGIWKAGAAFLPLDPSYPQQRLAFMLDDSQAHFLITEQRHLPRFTGNRLPTLCLEQRREAAPWQNFPQAEPEPTAGPDGLAYVMYTSGSTGVPKGAELCHRSMLNHSLSMTEVFGLTPGDRVLQFGTLSFDLALEEIFPTWLRGATLILRPEQAATSLKAFMTFVESENITVLDLPTAFWHEVVEFLREQPLPGCVRLVAIGGEKASPEAFATWKRFVPRSVRLLNTYGPTETTITATVFEADYSRPDLPIGRPIRNVTVRVLDEELQEVPVEYSGELFIGGKGLARGYRGRPELTAEKFVFRADESGQRQRFYATGDFVRLCRDGNLEYVGRRDAQVKIHGFRIELNEIEAALAQHECIREAVVIAREQTPSRKHLVAYYVPRRSRRVSVSELLAFLSKKLPAYMVPRTYVRLDRFPRSPSGKLERGRLPPPGAARPKLDHEYVAPRNETEAKLGDIWQDVLGICQVGMRDHFLELGGDSLLALQVTARVRQEFKRELPVTGLFEAPTVEQLASILQNTAKAELSPRPWSRGGALPVSFAQERLWFLHQLEPETDAYNMPAALRIKGRLDIPALERAFNHVIARHEMLRARFAVTERLAQTLSTDFRLGLQLQKLASASEGDLHRALSEESRRPFDLEKGPLLRVTLFHLGEKHHVLLLVVHHAIWDGWSIGLLFRELEMFYRDGQTELPPLPYQYIDYAGWQRAFMGGPVLERELGFWKQKLTGAPDEIPLGSYRGTRARFLPTNAAGRLEARLSRRKVERVLRAARQENLTPFMFLLSGLALTLFHSTRQDDLTIGTVVAGRTRSEVEHVIGCFMNFLPIRLQVQEQQTGTDLMRTVRGAVLEAQAHQDCPFEKIVSAVNPQRRSERNPLYNVALLWHNFPPAAAGEFRPPGLKISPIRLHPHTALLDLRLEIEQQAGAWEILCEYSMGVLEGARAARLLRSFTRALHFLASQPERKILSYNLEERAPLAWLYEPWR